jgi:transposase
MGISRGKTDRIDAKRIALFSYRYLDQVRLWIPERTVIKRLKNLITFRTRIIETIKSLKAPLKELEEFLNEEEYIRLSKFHFNTLIALENDLKLINKEIDGLIKEDERLSYLFSIVNSVSNIGPVTTAVIIATTNEFINITEGKRYACYAGVVPFQHQSGTSVKGQTRVSHIANKTVKTMLHMSALSSISRPGEFKDYYNRKIEEGKNKMSTINAIRNKLVLRVFACVRDGKLYDNNYQF